MRKTAGHHSVVYMLMSRKIIARLCTVYKASLPEGRITHCLHVCLSVHNTGRCENTPWAIKRSQLIFICNFVKKSLLD